MVVKYSELFKATDPTSHQPVTIHVEYAEAKNFQAVVIEVFEGVSNPMEEHSLSNDKVRDFIPMRLSDARQLVDALSGALQAAQGP